MNADLSKSGGSPQSTLAVYDVSEGLEVAKPDQKEKEKKKDRERSLSLECDRDKLSFD